MLLLVAGLVGVTARPALAQTPAPATISYQGVLTDASGAPVPDGPHTIALRLFPVATGGTATYAEEHDVTTLGGVFGVEIGAGVRATGLWSSVAFDRGYWLETVIGGTPLAPRTRLSASPYARSLTPGARIGAPASGSGLIVAGPIETTAGGIRYPDGTTQTSASTAFALPYTATASASGYLLNLTNTSGTGIQAITTGTIAIRGESAATTGSGVSGHATSATGTSYGGFFRSASTSGQAVYGQATASTGTTYGVYGRSQSSGGIAVYGTAPFTGVRGHASATTGTTYGVRGLASSTSGRAVYGEATAASGSTYGVYGTVASTSGRGVYGEVTATTGTTYGVYGISESSSGRGVYGRASATSGTNYGVQGSASGTTGRGVWGEGSSVSGVNYGGYFRTLSSAGYGLYAENFSPSGYAARFADAVRMDADLEFYEDTGTELRIVLDVDEGGNAPSLKLRRGNVTVIELDAEHNGDARIITEELEITGGSDLAEHFDVAPLAGLDAPLPGMVLSIDPAQAGRLAVSTTPYDPLVAGVVSGAGGVETGLIMGQRGSIADGDTPVALVGRVYVLVDAGYGPVRAGDLLTTSGTPGHAMRAADAERRSGAVLGKAMTALESGRGLVLVLVSLQ